MSRSTKRQCPVCRCLVRVTVGLQPRLYVHRTRGHRCLGGGMLIEDVDDADDAELAAFEERVDELGGLCREGVS